jgi:hypothetical protein
MTGVSSQVGTPSTSCKLSSSIRTAPKLLLLMYCVSPIRGSE